MTSLPDYYNDFSVKFKIMDLWTLPAISVKEIDSLASAIIL